MRRHHLPSLAVAAVLLMSCGGSGDQPSAAPTTAVETQPTEATTAPPDTPAPTTMAPLSDASEMLIQVLELDPGWIPDDQLSTIDERSPVEPPECDVTPNPTIAKVRAGFVNSSEGAALMHTISVYKDAATAQQELAQDLDLAQRCRTLMSDGVRLDIRSGGEVLDGEAFLSFEGVYTRMSDGGVSDMEVLELQRGPVISVMVLIGPTYIANLGILTRKVAARLPAADPALSTEFTIPIDTEPPAPETTSLAGGISDNLVFWEYFEVPQLGTEPVRGSGCGADGSLGAQLPDGLWNVWIRNWSATSMEVDVQCVYYGTSAQQLIDQTCPSDPESENCMYWSADWWPVNATEKYRTMPVSPNVTYAAGSLLNPMTNDPSSADATWSYYPSWVLVEDGAVRIVYSPPPYG